MKRKKLINKFSLPTNTGWSGTQNKTGYVLYPSPLFRKVILCTLLPLLLLGAVKTTAQDYSKALVNVDNVTDDSSLELSFAQSVTTAVVDGTTYLFVAGYLDNGVSVFSVANNGMLTSVTNVTDDGTLNLTGAVSVTTAVVDGTTYLFVAGFNDDGVSVFSIANNGILASVQNVRDTRDLYLSGAQSVTTAVAGGTTYLFVAGVFDDGVSVFSVANDDGMLTSVTNVTDAGSLQLDGAISVTTAVVEDTTYLFVAGNRDDGVSVFSVANNGMLTNVDNVDDDNNLELHGAISVTTAVVEDTTYLFVAGGSDDGVSMFRVGDTGALANVTNVRDNGTLNLRFTTSVTTAVVDGTTYLFVAGNQDDGVSVFRVEDAAGISPLGVEEEPGISMYPNPSEGSLAFSTGNYGSLSIKIYRINGALVFAGITRDTTPINIETLTAGSYVVQAAANGTTVFTSRLLKRDQGLLWG